MQSAGLLGQIGAAADNLDAVIYGLLAVAFLLAVLTIWYWRHTKPRPFVVQVAADSAPPVAEAVVPTDDNSVLERALDDSFDPDSVWADTPAAEVPAAPVVEKASLEPMSADEWLSITGPDNLTDGTPEKASDSTTS